MRNRGFGLLLAVLVVVAAPAIVMAGPMTGTELGTAVTWNAASTNALNYAQQTPDYVGLETPYVVFDSATPTSVTLTFSGPYTGISFFGSA